VYTKTCANQSSLWGTKTCLRGDGYSQENVPRRHKILGEDHSKEQFPGNDVLQGTSSHEIRAPGRPFLGANLSRERFSPRSPVLTGPKSSREPSAPGSTCHGTPLYQALIYPRNPLPGANGQDIVWIETTFLLVIIRILRQEMPGSQVPQLAQALPKSARGDWRACNRSGGGFGKCQSCNFKSLPQDLHPLSMTSSEAVQMYLVETDVKRVVI